MHEFLSLHPNGRERWRLEDGSTLEGVHRAADCEKQARCVIHAPTLHHMRGWRMSIDGPGGLMLRRCEHGWDHPDPDSLWYFRNVHIGTHWPGKPPVGLHTCDGCCNADA